MCSQKLKEAGRDTPITSRYCLACTENLKDKHGRGKVFNPGDDVQSERHIDSTGRVLYRKPVIPELAFVRWLRKESCTSL